MMRKCFVLLAILAALPALAEARQTRSAGGHVVHTRRAPVLLHRAVPPFKGVHVYQPGAK